MPNIIKIAIREYFYNIRKPSFLFTAFGTPAIIIGVWILVFAVFGNEPEREPVTQVGMVDLAGIISPDLAVEGMDFTPIPYPDEASARQSLDAEQIQAYFVIPEDYRQFGTLPIYSYVDLPNNFQSNIRRLIVTNVSQQAGVTLPLERVLNPVNDMSINILDTGRVLDSSGVIVTFLAPFFFSILFWIAMQTTGNFLMNGLVEEKKNRIIEVLVTTVTPGQLLTGKILGLGMLGMTQVAVWLGVAFFAITVGPQISFLESLRNVQLPADLVISGFIFFGMGYLFNAGLLAMVGVLAGNEQQSNQYSAFISLPGYLPPVFLIMEFLTNPNGPIATLLSMIPITAPFSMVLRISFGAVPMEQILLSLGILIVSTILVGWASGKIFLWGLLLYGKKIRLGELLRVVTSRKVTINTSISQPTGSEA